MEARDRLAGIAGRLQREALTQIGLRQTLEERWLQDLRQYNGEYEADVVTALKAGEGSQLFVNITRPKTRTIVSRISEMLFGSDDRNFGIKPTPVQSLTPQAMQQIVGTDEQGQPLPQATLQRMQSDAGRVSAENMEAEIDDQLRECDYAKHARAAIHDACTMGTGVIKGPVVIGRMRRSFELQNGAYVETAKQDPRPAAERVDPWNFFPDMGAARIEDARFVFERSYLTGLQMMALLDDQFYQRDAIIQAIRMGSKQSQLSRNPVNEKRESSGDAQVQQSVNEAYEIWTYWGPLTYGELRAAGAQTPGEMIDEMEVMACMVMCGQNILKAFIALDSRLPYAVFNYEKDEVSIFGFGLPRRMRNSQIGLNAAVRALMDNAALSVGPQYVYNKDKIEPADGDYRLKPKKGWALTDRSASVNDVFRTIDLSGHHGELMNLVQMWSKFADDETGIPTLLQGDTTAGLTKTANGIAMLMNAANVIVRAIVRNWDDGVTVPLIQKFYSWNMKYSPREDIKGDFDVDARGSTVLLAKEIQSQNLMTLSLQFAAHPIFGPMVKHAELLRKTVQSMSIMADEVVKTDDEIEAAAQAAAQAQQQAIGAGGAESPEAAAQQQALASGQAQMARVDAEAKAKESLEALRHRNEMEKLAADQAGKERLAAIERETVLMELANDRQISTEELSAMLQATQIKAKTTVQVAAVKAMP